MVYTTVEKVHQSLDVCLAVFDKIKDNDKRSISIKRSALCRHLVSNREEGGSPTLHRGTSHQYLHEHVRSRISVPTVVTQLRFDVPR